MWNERAWLQSDRAPVRDIHRGRPGYFTVYFPSVKNHHVILCEGSLEAACCVWFEWDSDVIAYYAQPHTFRWKTEQGWLRYTPDFFVLRKQAPNHFTEVKDDFGQLKAASQHKLASFMAHADARGILLRKADRQLLKPNPYYSNLRYLYFQSIGVSERERIYILDFLSRYKDRFSCQELFSENYPPSRRALYSLLVSGKLLIDLNQPLNIHSVVQQRSPL